MLHDAHCIVKCLPSALQVEKSCSGAEQPVCHLHIEHNGRHMILQIPTARQCSHPYKNCLSHGNKSESSQIHGKFPQTASAPGCSAHAITFCFPQKHERCQPQNKKFTEVIGFPFARVVLIASSQLSQGWSLPLGAVCWGIIQSQLNFLSGEAGLAQERVCWGQKHETGLAFCLPSVE